MFDKIDGFIRVYDETALYLRKTFQEIFTSTGNILVFRGGLGTRQ